MEDGEDGDADAEETEADAELDAKVASMANEHSGVDNEAHSGESEDGADDGASKSAIPALLQVHAATLHSLRILAGSSCSAGGHA